MQNAERELLVRSIASSMRDYLDLCAKEAEAAGADAQKVIDAVAQCAEELRLLVDCPEQCQINYQKCIADGGDPDECLEQKTTCMSECTSALN